MLIRGQDLRVGDVVKVHWRPYTDIVLELEDYVGPLTHLWNGAARIGRFGCLPLGMTIGPIDDFELIARTVVTAGNRTWPTQALDDLRDRKKVA